MTKKQTFFAALAFGAIAGSAIGLLYAPKEGKQTRSLLSYRLSKAQQKLKRLLDELVSGQDGENPIASMAKVEGEKVIHDAKTKAEKLLDDVESLITKIKKDKKT